MNEPRSENDLPILMPPADTADRRPLKTRGRPVAHAVARWLARHGATPNAISVAGVVVAAAVGACLVLVPGAPTAAAQALLLAGAAAGIQLRLAANMLDGLVAVEGGLGTRTGPLFNEVPDRLADLLILVSAGYAISWVGWGPELGWAAGALALLTAYVRLLGGALGQPQRFSGPLAKPQRMFVLTVACLASMVELAVSELRGVALTAGLAVIVLGCALTIVARLRAIASALPPEPRR
jgi:phosphatidylglycerophosphate synthase